MLILFDSFSDKRYICIHLLWKVKYINASLEYPIMSIFLHNFLFLWKVLVGFSEGAWCEHWIRSKSFSIGFKRGLWLSYTELWCVNNSKGWLYDFLLWRVNFFYLKWNKYIINYRNHTMDSQISFVPHYLPCDPQLNFGCFLFYILCQFCLFLLKQIKLSWGRFVTVFKTS